jgi:hypothetical protein
MAVTRVSPIFDPLLFSWFSNFKNEYEGDHVREDDYNNEMDVLDRERSLKMRERTKTKKVLATAGEIYFILPEMCNF